MPSRYEDEGDGEYDGQIILPSPSRDKPYYMVETMMRRDELQYLIGHSSVMGGHRCTNCHHYYGLHCPVHVKASPRHCMVCYCGDFEAIKPPKEAAG